MSLRITPTYQMVLNTQILRIMDAIDEGNLMLAFVSSHTLVSSLKPSDRDKLLKDWIFPVKRMLERAGNGRLDFYVAGVGVSKQQNAILRKNIRQIHTAIMGTLHNGNYLELNLKPRFPGDRKLTA